MDLSFYPGTINAFKARAESGDKANPADLPLLDFVQAVTPQTYGRPTLRPHHLAPLCDLFERARTEQVRAVISVPPRHGKSTVALHAVVWWLMRNPYARVMYVSHNTKFAERQSKDCRIVARSAGLGIDPKRDNIAEWHTDKGGSVYWSGITSGLQGLGADLLIADDLLPGRAAANSKVQRDNVHQAFTVDAMSRVHPGGSSFVINTRWHEDDTPGRLAKEGWEVVNLPALDEYDAPLWPEARPLEYLNEIRNRPNGLYDWWSLYMGQPRPTGDSIFGPPMVYDTAQSHAGPFAIGYDLAYSGKTTSDYSVAVVLGRVGNGAEVLEVIRKQCTPEVFFAAIAGLTNRYPGAARRWYRSGTESAAEGWALTKGVYLGGVDARGDKLTRARPASAAWNAGLLKVPRSAPWLDAFLSEVQSFTGVGDAHDDQVDALAAAWDALPGTGSLEIETGELYRSAGLKKWM